MKLIYALVLFPLTSWAASITVTPGCDEYVCKAAPPPVTPPPIVLPGQPVTCTGYTQTHNMAFEYVPGSGQVVKQSPTLATTDILVARFTTPPNLTNGGSGGSIVVNDNAQGSAGFVGGFSTTPCDLITAQQGGKYSAQWSFTVFRLKPSTTYYLSVKGDSVLSIKLGAK